jgi:hypothetical protein
MVDPDTTRMVDLSARVSRPPVAALANYLETWRVMETFTNISAALLS